MTSIKEAIDSLTERHIQYIESSYHLSNHRLIDERKMLMHEGEVHSPTWIEATPTYVEGKSFEESELPEAVRRILLDAQAVGAGVHKRPYVHQAEALKRFFVDEKDIIISTGTGSGKTEIFLYSILGSLALESERGKTTNLRAMRAILLYPMNALVSDQLARLRRMFGRETGAKVLRKRFNRDVQFGMYTSRTPYHGRNDPERNERRVRPVIQYFIDLQEKRPDLFNELKNRGRVPEKDLVGFLNGSARAPKYTTQDGDCELFTRQEMHAQSRFGGPPDLLITNYSMLEYMLLRPIEQSLFNNTKKWLQADSENKLIIVIDEAHLYRGAQGAEVALLIRRLLQHLDVGRDRVRFILTSASLGSGDEAKASGPKFAADLSASSPDNFAVIIGKRVTLGGGKSSNAKHATAIADAPYSIDRSTIEVLANKLSWAPVPTLDGQLLRYLSEQLIDTPVFRLLYDTVTGGPKRLAETSSILFPDMDEYSREEATLKLLYLGSQAYRTDTERLMPTRLHLFFKGLTHQYICINPRCNGRRAGDAMHDFLGRLYTEPRFQCDCGGRVFELLTHRTCGAAYIRAYRNKKENDMAMSFLWTEAEQDDNFEEIHILLERPRSDEDPNHRLGTPQIEQHPPRYLNVRTGHLLKKKPQNEDDYIVVYAPQKRVGSRKDAPFSWRTCPVCGIKDGRPNGESNIMDLETKGEEIFANLVKTEFQFQPTVAGHEQYPNKGRKVLCFSDSRQKAARLARDLQRTVERDSFREIILDSVLKIPTNGSLQSLYPAVLISTSKHGISLFDDGDHVNDAYDGSRTVFIACQNNLDFVAKDNGLTRIEDILTNDDAIEELNSKRPKAYDVNLLRVLGDKYYSLRAMLVAYLVPNEDVLSSLFLTNPTVDKKVLREILVEVLHQAAIEQAYDPSISETARRNARGTISKPEGYERTGSELLLQEELIPSGVRNRLSSMLTDEQLDTLVKTLRKTGQNNAPKLFSPKGDRYAINPDAVQLKIALEDEWFRCQGCRQFTPLGIAGKCPSCGASLIPVERNDKHLLARKALFRDPCLKVVKGERAPFVIRSEEHSAQLSEKDFSEVFPKSENYELLFQDIRLNEDKSEQPIDVLSCTTTMEVGIDIGSLTGVALRTVPPLPANYQQRAGRAGRRGSALSVIITFADNSPHETFHFDHPDRLIGADPAKPIVYIGNQKICERHINATLIERFFQSVPVTEDADVFKSLGSSREFFLGNGEYSLGPFKEWVIQNFESKDSVVIRALVDLLPDEVLDNSLSTTKEEFVRIAVASFIKKLDTLANKDDWPEEDSDSDSLLRALLNAALIPTFSFPIDVCTFTVNEVDRKQRRVVTKYEPSLSLAQALSDYAPGRQVVMDKKTYTSYGLYYPFVQNKLSRAANQNWDSLEWLNYCETCETIVDERRESLQSMNQTCPIPECGSQLKSVPLLTPKGFSPEYRPKGVQEGEHLEDDRVYAQPAKLPLPIEHPKEIATIERGYSLARGGVRKLPNQDLIVVNRGQNDDGYTICKECGAIGGQNGLPSSHNRPYPKDPRFRGRWIDKCSGQTIQSTLGYTFKTDLTLLRVRIQKPLSWAFSSEWFVAAARTLSESMVLGATRALSIDAGEIAGDYRLYPRYPNDKPEILGYVDFFLYDTTPGGAGFAAEVFESFEKVLKHSNDVLRCNCVQSCHSCLRTYNNRIWHRTMDRHLGAALLNYVIDGKINPIDANRASELLGRLDSSIKLINPSIKTTQSDGKLSVSLNNQSVGISVRQCLLEKSIVRAGALEISDYEIMHNLPQVAHSVVSTLKGNKEFGKR